MNKDLKNKVLKSSIELMRLHKKGELGGEVMPEDKNTGFGIGTKENYLYFTLPMALNYQRNSYKLWESALSACNDPETSDIFRPEDVVQMSKDTLKEKLVKHKVALQPNKQTDIWYTLCSTLNENFNADIRQLFAKCNFSIKEVKEYISTHKKEFPYLAGPKILNYWLYVMTQYTDGDFCDRNHITVAPDTHVIQASVRLGLIQPEDVDKNNIREIVSNLWEEVFEGTVYCPIDIHTPLWLWSRGGFHVSIGDDLIE